VAENPSSSFYWPVRVYYEDTDAGGIVYYANFLRFFERCRTEWLRALGVDQQRMMTTDGLQFVVTSAAIDFHRPARLDDELVISAEIAQTARSFIVFAQKAMRGTELLATATVKVACLNARTMAPTRLPATLIKRITESTPI
jgi:acyl-CoA thioester hydrolase